MDYIEISAKTVEEAVAQALAQLSVTSDKLEYEVVDEGSAGFLGMFGSKPAVIRARKKFDLIEYTQDFVDRLFQAMDVEVSSDISYDELVQKGESCDLDTIEQDIIERDNRDMHREISPLRQAEDAILVDSSNMTIDEVVDKIISLTDRG